MPVGKPGFGKALELLSRLKIASDRRSSPSQIKLGIEDSCRKFSKMSWPRAWRMVPPFKSIKLYAGIRNIIAKFVISKIRRPLLRLVRQMSYQVKGISNLKYTRDIPEQNSGMGGYGFIPAPRNMSIRWTGNTHPFHKSRVFLSGMGFRYELRCTTLLSTLHT